MELKREKEPGDIPISDLPPEARANIVLGVGFSTLFFPKCLSKERKPSYRLGLQFLEGRSGCCCIFWQGVNPVSQNKYDARGETQFLGRGWSEVSFLLSTGQKLKFEFDKGFSFGSRNSSPLSTGDPKAIRGFSSSLSTTKLKCQDLIL